MSFLLRSAVAVTAPNRDSTAATFMCKSSI
ncbi:MAG: hypothetical protein ACI9W7_001795 [Porticoccaceae bacterium]